MEQPTTTSDAQPMTTRKVVFGVVLVVIGITAFLEAVEIWNPRALWQYWPLILIAIGVGSEVEALRNRRSGSGAFLVALGVWFLVATQEWFDLSLRQAMPIGIAVWGAFLTLHAIVDRPKPVQEKKS
jgi:hypothetical protein